MKNHERRSLPSTPFLPFAVDCCVLLLPSFYQLHRHFISTQKKSWIPELCWRIPHTFLPFSLHISSPRGTYLPTECLICWSLTTLNHQKLQTKLQMSWNYFKTSFLGKDITTLVEPKIKKTWILFEKNTDPSLACWLRVTDCYILFLFLPEHSVLLQRAVVTTSSWPTKVLPGQYCTQWGGGHWQERLPWPPPPGLATATGNSNYLNSNKPDKELGDEALHC